jgi:hypothetical protein
VHEPDPGRATPSVLVATPSYAPDFELCKDLNRSFLRHAPTTWRHRILVPRRDVALFRGLAGERTDVVDVGSYLDRRIVKIPAVNGWLNLTRPWPPLRGWITQQLVKISVAARTQAPFLLLVDSDIAFVRDFSGETYSVDGRPARYRADAAVHEGMARHLEWHRVARELLGLPAASAPPLPDYISWPSLWEPRIVRDMLARVEEVTGRAWQTAIGSRLHFSEMILYGVYVDELRPGSSPTTADMHCQGHSDEEALDEPAIAELLAGLRETDVAVMVSAKSGTDLEVRRRALRRFAG